MKSASDTITRNPSAMQLRYLQTLNTISAEKNSTIIFPVPLGGIRLQNFGIPLPGFSMHYFQTCCATWLAGESHNSVGKKATGYMGGRISLLPPNSCSQRTHVLSWKRKIIRTKVNLNKDFSNVHPFRCPVKQNG